jgi:hypothetical protein
MKTNALLKRSSILMIGAISLISSCNDEERITAEDSQDISEESITDSYFQDMDDMVGVAIQAPTEAQFSGGRTKGTFQVSDARFHCDGAPLTITVETGITSTASMPRGGITIDFGTGCTDVRGNVRSGKIVIMYSGRRFMPNSFLIVSGRDYTINGVKLEGTRTITNVTGSTDVAPRFNVVLPNGKATFEDNSVAERKCNITTQWIRGATAAEDKLIVEQGSWAEGITRAGRDYKVTIEEQLEFKRFCGIAVTGIKHYLIGNQKEVTLDYGDGECDREVAVTVNGVARNIRVN